MVSVHEGDGITTLAGQQIWDDSDSCDCPEDCIWMRLVGRLNHKISVRAWQYCSMEMFRQMVLSQDEAEKSTFRKAARILWTGQPHNTEYTQNSEDFSTWLMDPSPLEGGAHRGVRRVFHVLDRIFDGVSFRCNDYEQYVGAMRYTLEPRADADRHFLLRFAYLYERHQLALGHLPSLFVCGAVPGPESPRPLWVAVTPAGFLEHRGQLQGVDS